MVRSTNALKIDVDGQCERQRRNCEGMPPCHASFLRIVLRYHIEGFTAEAKGPDQDGLGEPIAVAPHFRCFFLPPQ
jgi:hypothetical protein